MPISPLATTILIEQKKRNRTDYKETGQSMPPNFETEIKLEEEKMVTKVPFDKHLSIENVPSYGSDQ